MAGTTMRTFLSWRTAALCGLAWFCGAALAADEDPPDRVARLSYIKGEASLKPRGSQDWAPASVNRPLTTDDQLWLDRDARAEMQVGSSDIHLGEQTAFSFTDLSDDALQMRLTEGDMYLRVRRVRDDEAIEVDTPHAAVVITRPGEYRISLVDRGERTLVKTFEGECEVAGASEPMRVRAGEQTSVGDDGRLARESFDGADGFDRWAQERNERGRRSASARYVSPDVIGYEDLDEHGRWAREPEYGYVWFPTRVAAGWSPYRFGHWVFIAPWGWTWVDDAPWGFAPFHYGRWAYIGARWAWVPGPVRVRAVYAPALVAWVGSPSFSVSVSIGNVGWFPLAPREVYVPAYRCSRTHLHSVNYANTTIVNNVIINRVYVNRSTHIDYRNRNVGDAVTVTTHEAFSNARPVRDHMVRAGERDRREWRTINAAPQIEPGRGGSFGPRWRDGEAHGPSRDVETRLGRQVVMQRTPPERSQWRGMPQQSGPEDRPARPNMRLDSPRERNFQRGNDGAAGQGPGPGDTRVAPRERPRFDRNGEVNDVSRSPRQFERGNGNGPDVSQSPGQLDRNVDPGATRERPQFDRRQDAEPPRNRAQFERPAERTAPRTYEQRAPERREAPRYTPPPEPRQQPSAPPPRAEPRPAPERPNRSDDSDRSERNDRSRAPDGARLLER